jgi:hypothetical protein
MFYTEEDVQPVVDMTTELFGTVGSMSAEKNVLKNIVIFSKQYGKLWYGDIEDQMENIHTKCNQIAQKFSISVEPINDV